MIQKDIAARQPSTTNSRGLRWVGTWAAPQQLTERGDFPPEPGFSGNTLRQVVRTSIGGEKLRVTLSNEYGDQPLVVSAAQIARSAGGGTVRPGTDARLTWGGHSEIAIPPGARFTSDPAELRVDALIELCVTLRLLEAPTAVTGHPGSRTTSYLASGDAVSALSLPNASKVEHWYFLCGVDVLADPDSRVLVTVGDSITDGRGSTTDGNDRWPDGLSRRLRDNPRTAGVAVLNGGIGGNRVLNDGLGPSLLSRFDRDVLALPAVRWVIVLEGINDLGTAATSRERGERPATARDLILAYEQLASRAHDHGILVYGATLLPFEGSFFFDAAAELERQRVNGWIRGTPSLDAVIDFDALARDPAHPARLQVDFHGGDFLHPTAAAYARMADFVDRSLFAVE